MLAFERVSFGFADRKILNDVSFSLRAGEFAVLLGENGAGKSTLLRLCNGLLKPQNGVVRALGQDTKQVKTSLLARDVGFLFQNPDRQICQKTVREELRFGLMLSGKAAQADADCDALLAEFGLHGEADPFSLSSGMRQYVAIASVLVCRPKLLLLDEPTTWLDDAQSEKFLDAVERRRQEGAAVLMITHDLALAGRAATRTLTLQEGRLSE
ncbi:MAG: energy-coupling factor ABC transporter ATP-binding protein [Oscillospiraceae bacterium]|jgi:energy-coupling factor transport system ATP-binding protein|nr:energy-coupling factor ABC transporter ATP-binding protein [Oscillospiraceae bacterium]